MQAFVSLEKGTLRRLGLEVDPAVFEPARDIMSQCGQWSIVVWRHEQTGFEKGLEAVADTQDQFLGVTEPAKGIEGSTAVSATAATVVSTAARPIDENTPFRANIAISSVGAWPDRPWIANHRTDVRFPNPNAS